jgi:hypothetical protein
VIIYPWPAGVRWSRMTPKGGPTVLGVSSSLTDYTQVVEAPTGLVAFDLEFNPAKGPEARARRGLVAQLSGGADAVRMPFCDPDRMGNSYIGWAPTQSQLTSGVPWSADQPWYTLQNWALSLPQATASASAAKGATTVSITVTDWGGKLDVGTIFGFAGHFGIYTVKWSTISGSVATVTIWPPLRRAVASGAFVTLAPDIVVTLSNPAGAQFTRGPTFQDSFSLSLREVPDEVVRAYGVRPDGTTYA